MLDRNTFLGPWAGLPVAWTDDDRFDEPRHRACVAWCCEAGAPGVYTGGTTGEFYAMDWREFQAVARATVEECHARGKPAMVGCTATCTREACRRAEFAVEIAADAVQVALPFWLETPDDQVVPFFRDVAAACALPLSIYETTRAKKALSVDQHRAVVEAVPAYCMVKANAGTVGCTPEGCRVLSEYVNVFVGEPRWAELGPAGAVGGCSSMIYWNPRLVLDLWRLMRDGSWSELREALAPVRALHAFLVETFGPRGFADSAYDRLGALACGGVRTSLRCRAPYPSADERDVERLRDWLHARWPVWLAQG